MPPLLKVGGGGKFFVFFTLGGAYMLAGFMVLSMNATKKLIADESPNPSPP